MTTSQENEVPLLSCVADSDNNKQPTIGYPLNWCVFPNKKPQTQPEKTTPPPSTSGGGGTNNKINRSVITRETRGHTSDELRFLCTCCSVLFIICLCVLAFCTWAIVTDKNVPVTVRLNSFNVSSMDISNNSTSTITADLNVTLSVKTMKYTMYFDPLTVWVKYRYVLLASTKVEGFRVKKYSLETLPTLDLRVRAQLDNVTADAMVRDLANFEALEFILIARGRISSKGVDCDMETVCSDINVGFSNHHSIRNGSMANEASCKARQH